MLITDKQELKNYADKHRIWQGIPGIEVTSGGNVFLTFYSGGIKEEIGNYVLLFRSDKSLVMGDPILAVYLPDHRCYDPCLWIDPLGRLWLTWACAPDHATYASICNDPDAEELVWSDPRIIGHDVMMNKPTVLSTGEWLFPIAVWNGDVAEAVPKAEIPQDNGAYVYRSLDRGATLERLGGASIPNRSFDEHMILEQEDGSLSMLIRTTYGIGIARSFDGGRTWSAGEDSTLGGPCSRFFIRRLRSGRILLINHFGFKGRSHLHAMLSEDDGKTFPHKLLLDERRHVSYPDATEAPDGSIYITYDRERGGFLQSLDEVYRNAREILVARITEEDILAGRIVSETSRLQIVVSKLGKYAEENKNPFGELKRLSTSALAQHLSKQSAEEILTYLFNTYPINCINLHKLDRQLLDSLIDKLRESDEKKRDALPEIIRLLRSVSDFSVEEAPVVTKIKAFLGRSYAEEISTDELACAVGVSKYYMCHLFKSHTGLTISEYKNALRIAEAKRLLVSSSRRIADIAYECGFADESYFSKKFRESEGVSPTKYRELLGTPAARSESEDDYEATNHG